MVASRHCGPPPFVGAWILSQSRNENVTNRFRESSPPRFSSQPVKSSWFKRVGRCVLCGLGQTAAERTWRRQRNDFRPAQPGGRRKTEAEGPFRATTRPRMLHCVRASTCSKHLASFAKPCKNVFSQVSTRQRCKGPARLRLFSSTTAARTQHGLHLEGIQQTNLALSDAQRQTIYALSTPPGKGGVAVIRVSGPAALDVWTRMVARNASRKGLHAKPEPWKMERCHIVDPLSKEVLDDGLAVFFKGALPDV